MALFGAFAPFILPMAVGALTSMAARRSPIEGAALGAATQGLLGGIDFGGASGLFGNGAAAASSNLTPTTTAGFGGASMFGSANPVVEGLSTSLPATTGQYSSIYGGNSALQNYDVGMGGVQANFGAYNTPGFQGGAINSPYPQWDSTVVNKTGVTPYDTSYATGGGYVPTQDELDTATNIKQHGGLIDQGTTPENTKIFEGIIGDEVKPTEFMAYNNLINQAYNAQTAETPLVQGADTGSKIIRKEINPQKGKLLAINVPDYNIDKKISFYGRNA